MINTKLETITPAIAKKYLQSNVLNRPIRWKHMDNLKQEILGGRWLVTHQGIAFDDEGHLLDGQHRLLAIEASGKTVQSLVTRGMDPHVNGDINLYTMDVIDTGRGRSAADQLNLLHGVDNANLTVGALRTIIGIFIPGLKRSKITTGQCVPILKLYGDDIKKMISLGANSKLCRKAALVGVLALGNKIDPQVANEFMTAMNTGEDIKRGDPVYALREYVISNGFGNGVNEREHNLQLIANAFYHTIKGSTINVLKNGFHGIDFLRSRHRANSDKVREHLLPQ